MIGSFGMLLHWSLGNNLYKRIPFSLDGTIYKRYCIDLRIKLAGYPDTLFQKVHRRCRGHSSIKTTQIYLDSFESGQKREITKFLTSFKTKG